MDNSNIPTSDTRLNHLGKLVIAGLKSTPDDVQQIDAHTGLQETCASVLKRSIALATALRNYGLKPGDVLALAGPKHLDINIPYYAALYNGLPILGVDPLYKYDEIRRILSVARPKVIFCQEDLRETMRSVSDSLELGAKLVSFGGRYTMTDFTKEYQDKEVNSPRYMFRPVEIDTRTSYCWLASTSGTTGVPKIAAFTHDVIADTLYFYNEFLSTSLSSGKGISLNLSPVQWISSYISTLFSPTRNEISLQSSGPLDAESIAKIINKYRPASAVFGPVLIGQIVALPREQCDLSCFKFITLTGSKVRRELYLELVERVGVVLEAYGLTETMGPCLVAFPSMPMGSCGASFDRFQMKLVDQETGKTIEEPNTPGELYVKGPGFTEYYNNPVETAKAFEDGWYKTGDLLYRDKEDCYFYVDRLKMLIKHRNISISPMELEEAIMEHSGVKDVIIVGLPHEELAELPVACVVRSEGSTISEEEIKNIVASKFSDAKQLRGGVIFVDELPMTSSGKIARNKVRQFVEETHKNSVKAA